MTKVYLQATIAGSANSVAGSSATISGLTVSANSVIRMRTQMFGTNPTTIRMRVWADGSTEPSSWAFSVSESTPAMQAAGPFGMRSFRNSGATGSTIITASIDDYLVTAFTGGAMAPQQEQRAFQGSGVGDQGAGEQANRRTGEQAVAMSAAGHAARPLPSADRPIFNSFGKALLRQLNQSIPAATRTITYTYDGLQRLTGAQENPGTTQTYAYDLAGNRTGVWVNGTQTQNYSYNAANQVTGWSYDNVGNVLNDGTTAYTYDALNRVLSVGTTTNQYNGDGTLVAQTQSSVTTRYTQDLAAPLSQILSDGTNRYIYGTPAERLFAQQGSAARTWYDPDALGSLRQLLSATGSVTARASYDAWGVPETPLIGSFGFTGELQRGSDVWLRARWYGAGRGSFGSRDPYAGDAQTPYSLMYYQYGYSNPVLYSDPSGQRASSGEEGGSCAPGIKMPDGRCQPPPNQNFAPSSPPVAPPVVPPPVRPPVPPPVRPPVAPAPVPEIPWWAPLGEFGLACLRAVSIIAFAPLLTCSGICPENRQQPAPQPQQPTPPASSPTPERENVMRVQLQRDRERLDSTIAITASPNKGVTTYQVRQGMSQLYENAKAQIPNYTWFPFSSLGSWLRGSIIELSEELKRYPPAGETRQYYNILRRETILKGKTYRLDIENISGHNLKE